MAFLRCLVSLTLRDLVTTLRFLNFDHLSGLALIVLATHDSRLIVFPNDNSLALPTDFELLLAMLEFFMMDSLTDFLVLKDVGNTSIHVLM